MPGVVRLRVHLRSAIALGVALGCVGLACAGPVAGPAFAVTPSPPPGAPAVESARSSLVGLNPELPPGVIAASAAPGSHWAPEKATYGTASTNDIAPSGASYPLTEGALLGSLRAVDAGRSWAANGMTTLPYHPYTQASSKPVTPGAVTEYQIHIFPTLATIASGDRLRLTLATTDTPHLTPLPGQLPELAGGVYSIARSVADPSSLAVDLLK